mmetsp:Transcript_18198/g.50679  ORF Transcript_18198/g.50679 Transcript_18198/m.50679 type:complete len:375 (+) Transcript_18198:1508-2632(+)
MVELHDGSQIEGNGVDTEAEYFKLEQEMEKYVTALELTEEWIEEQAEEERKWEDEMKEENEIALKMVLRHMPVDVRNRSESQLQQLPTPNEKFLTRSIAQKFKRTNCLQLLRTNPEEMVKWHPSMFENLRVTGLTLTERRALHHHLKTIGDCWKKQCTGSGDKMTERKIVWFETLKSNFRESLRAYVRHVDAYGPPENHCCSMIGRQCPLKADKAIDYSGDYGYSEDSKYFKQTNGSLNSSDEGVTKCTKLDDKIHDQIGESSLSISAERALSNGRRTSIEDSVQCRNGDIGRGGLLRQIQGRGTGRGRGGFLNEIQGRGLCGGGRGRGREGYSGEIHGRGQCGRGRDRKGLLHEIQGRDLGGSLDGTKGRGVH